MLIASVVYIFICFTLPSIYKLIHPETSLFYNIWGLGRNWEERQLKDGRKSNKKITLNWSNVCSSTPRRKGWLEVEHEVDLHSVTLLFKIANKKGWLDAEHEVDLHLVTLLFKIAKKKGWLEAQHEVDLHVVIFLFISI